MTMEFVIRTDLNGAQGRSISEEIEIAAGLSEHDRMANCVLRIASPIEAEQVTGRMALPKHGEFLFNGDLTALKREIKHAASVYTLMQNTRFDFKCI